MCIFVCIFYINNTAKGNTSLMLNKLLLHNDSVYTSARCESNSNLNLECIIRNFNFNLTTSSKCAYITFVEYQY